MIFIVIVAIIVLFATILRIRFRWHRKKTVEMQNAVVDKRVTTLTGLTEEEFYPAMTENMAKAVASPKDRSIEKNVLEKAISVRWIQLNQEISMLRNQQNNLKDNIFDSLEVLLSFSKREECRGQKWRGRTLDKNLNLIKKALKTHPMKFYASCKENEVSPWLQFSTAFHHNAAPNKMKEFDELLIASNILAEKYWEVERQLNNAKEDNKRLSTFLDQNSEMMTALNIDIHIEINITANINTNLEPDEKSE